MARKKRKTYTAEELPALKKRIEAHRDELIAKLRGHVDELSSGDQWETAVAVRDNAQLLVTTLLIFRTWEPIMFWAKRGEPQSVPHLEDCGLDLE